MVRWRLLLLPVLLLVPACGGETLDTVMQPEDAGHVDAGHEDAGHADAGHEDAGHEDAGPIDAGHEDAGPVDAGPVDAGIPCMTTWSYAANPGADTSDCGQGFDTAALTIDLCAAPKMTVTEGSGLLSATYKGTYDATTGAWMVSGGDGIGDTQGFDCTFSADFMTFTGNYFFDQMTLGSCTAMIPVTGTRM